MIVARLKIDDDGTTRTTTSITIMTATMTPIPTPTVYYQYDSFLSLFKENNVTTVKYVQT